MTDDKHSPLGDDVDPSGEHLAADLPDPAEFQVRDEEAEELVDGDSVVDHTPDRADPEDAVVDDPQQLAAAESVAARARSARPVKRSASSAEHASTTGVAKAGTSRRTPRRPEPRTQRTTPGMFVNQSVGELKKVNWPTGDQLRQYFIVVLAFVVLIIAFVGLLDLAFGWVLLKLLGGETPQ